MAAERIYLEPGRSTRGPKYALNSLCNKNYVYSNFTQVISQITPFIIFQYSTMKFILIIYYNLEPKNGIIYCKYTVPSAACHAHIPPINSTNIDWSRNWMTKESVTIFSTFSNSCLVWINKLKNTVCTSLLQRLDLQSTCFTLNSNYWVIGCCVFKVWGILKHCLRSYNNCAIKHNNLWVHGNDEGYISTHMCKVTIYKRKYNNQWVHDYDQSYTSTHM